MLCLHMCKHNCTYIKSFRACNEDSKKALVSFFLSSFNFLPFGNRVSAKAGFEHPWLLLQPTKYVASE